MCKWFSQQRDECLGQVPVLHRPSVDRIFALLLLSRPRITVNPGILACVFIDIPAPDMESSSLLEDVTSAAIKMALADIGRPNLLPDVLVFLLRANAIVGAQLLFIREIEIDEVKHVIPSTM